MFGAIEAGGSKFVCAVGTSPTDLFSRIEFPTHSPAETLGQVAEYFEIQAKREPLQAIGIASFGPVELDPTSPQFGFITTTPKAGWQNVDLVGTFRKKFNVPIAFETDVNAAALGEQRWGAAQGLDTLVYVTAGTGIGGGGLVAGRLMHGALHPEMGHMIIAHDWKADPFPGVCPFHGDCWEGLASGPAIEARWGAKAEFLLNDHHSWQLEAHYMALGVANLIYVLSPQRIILGGGVMRQNGLFPLIRRETVELLNGYIQANRITEDIDNYVIPPRLGSNAGVLGALALAEAAAKG
ncbi:MAG TPA: ROK family protein [Terriglobia bacterium]|nr:ROK family protein [Terriglobia bacterium]